MGGMRWWLVCQAVTIVSLLALSVAGASGSTSEPSLAPFGPVPNLQAQVDELGQVTLTWDPVEDAVSYWVDGGARPGIDNRRVTDTRYEDARELAGVTYVYRVFSERADGQWSEPATVQSIDPATLPPFGTPANPRITDIAELRQLIQWDQVASAVRYDLLLDGEPLASTPAGQSAYFATNVITTNEQRWRIDIIAVRDDGTTADPAVVFYGEDLPPFGAPGNPRVADLAADGSVTLRWDRVADAQDYVVHRDGRYLGPVTGRVDTFVDRTATAGVSYRYEIRAVRYEVRSPGAEPLRIFSLPSAVRTSAGGGLPSFGTPADAAVVVDPTGPATVTWDQVGDAKGYLIHRDNGYVPDRDPDDSRWQYIGFVPAGSSTYVDSTAQPGQPYRYAIRAQRPDGSYSIPAVVDDLPPFGPPRDVAAELVGDMVVLRWSPVAGADSYVVHRDGVYVTWRQAVTELTLDQPAPPPGQSQRYEVRAKRVDGTYSEPSVVTVRG